MFPRTLQEAIEFYGSECRWGKPVSFTYHHNYSATIEDSWIAVYRLERINSSGHEWVDLNTITATVPSYRPR